eukprot:5401893-Alexandrium_andersonii.AAC.1
MADCHCCRPPARAAPESATARGAKHVRLWRPIAVRASAGEREAAGAQSSGHGQKGVRGCGHARAINSIMA